MHYLLAQCSPTPVAGNYTPYNPTPSGQGRVPAPNKPLAWEINLGFEWTKYDAGTQELLNAAVTAGRSSVTYSARGQTYTVDLQNSVQINQRTGATRHIRSTTQESDVSELAVLLPTPARSERLVFLVNHLLSPSVQVALPKEFKDEPLRLRAEEVKKVFIDNVPGVERFVYQGREGHYVLGLIAAAYSDGLPAYVDTPIHDHLLSLLRMVVHYGCDGKPGMARHLRDVAEAFMDCQAVQARVIERVGFDVQGGPSDLRGLVAHLVGEYKSMALKMLAVEHVRQGKAADDRSNPVHYENRLAADVGELIGLNSDDIRRAKLDGHSLRRFQSLSQVDRVNAAARCRELFDVDALVTSFASEVNRLSEDSAAASLPRKFIDWACTTLTNRYAIFNNLECTRLDLGEPLALASLEMLFLGRVGAAETELYGGKPIKALFAS